MTPSARICLLAVAATLLATVSIAPQTRPLVITHVNVIDVSDGRIAANSTVTIGDTTIASVRQDPEPPPGLGAESAPLRRQR
jgi:hypothetical protein